MKRYWKLLVLAPFIVLSIGTYYVQASGDLPDCVLQLQAGDEKEASSLTIQARYKNDSVSIGSKGCQYQSEQSFWATLGPANVQSPIYTLVKEHPNFMRGRSNPYAAYEDDQVIGYADHLYSRRQINASFRISLYDKKLKKDSSFDILLPKQNDYEFINIHDVQIEQKTLKLVTFNSVRNVRSPSSASQEAHLYTLNLDKKSVENDQVLFSGGGQGENIRVMLMPAIEMETTKPNRHIVFQAVHYRADIQKGRNISETIDKRELFAYDLGSGKQTVIQDGPIGELLKGTMGLTLKQAGGDLFLTVGGEAKGPRVIRYDLVENKVKTDYSIAVKDYKPMGDGMNQMVIAKNRLYTLVNTSTAGRNEPAMIIADLNTGGVVYQGVIVRKDHEPLSNLMFENIVVQ